MTTKRPLRDEVEELRSIVAVHPLARARSALSGNRGALIGFYTRITCGTLSL